MRSIVELNKEMVFNREMTELVNILKRIAISQFQSLLARQKNIRGRQKYLTLLESFFEMIDFTRVRHPVIKNPTTNLLLVIVSSDMGFLGGLSTYLMEEALRQIGKKDKKVNILVLGEKGRDYLEDMEQDFDYLPGVTDGIKPAEAERVSQYIFVTAIREKIGRVVIAYPKFFSFVHQEVECLQLLPRALPAQPPESLPEMLKSVAYEPFLDKVVDYLLRKWLISRVDDIFWHSKLSEFAARSMHLEGSSMELKDMKKVIEMQYFRSKHELTDRTIRDIFAGRLATNRRKSYASG